jgi:putative membrane protein
VSTVLASGPMGGMTTGGAAPPVDLHSILTGWSHGPFALTAGVVLLATGVWYVRAVGRVRAKGRSWGTGRVVAFLAGLVMVELALGSAVATLSMTSFPTHIVQHLLLMIVAPPLLALGAPSTLVLQTADRRVRAAWLSVLHSPPFAVLTHPVTVWFLYYGAMFAFFLSPALGYAMDHMAVMDCWNIGFFVGAVCFWWPMVGLDPIPRWRMGYGMRFLNLLIGVPFESFLGIAILSMKSPIAPMYTASGTYAGGGLLWGMTELLTVVAMVPIFVQWSKADLRQAKRNDARLDAEAALVAAGRPVPERAAGADPAKLRGMAATFAAIRREPMD